MRHRNPSRYAAWAVTMRPESMTTFVKSSVDEDELSAKNLSPESVMMTDMRPEALRRDEELPETIRQITLPNSSDLMTWCWALPLIMGYYARDSITMPGLSALALSHSLRSAMCSYRKSVNLRTSLSCITNCNAAMFEIYPHHEKKRRSRDHVRDVEVASRRYASSSLKSYCHRAWIFKEITNWKAQAYHSQKRTHLRWRRWDKVLRSYWEQE